MDPKQIVRQGYDRVSYAYRAEGAPANVSHYLGWLAELIPLLRPGSSVLDLGCGCGYPVSKDLADTFQITGVDISPVQIRRAQAAIPNGSFICQDMAGIAFPVESFEAVVSFYAIIHLPLEEQYLLFCRIKEWLKPGGWLMATVGSQEWTGTEKDWLGVEGAEMYWSHAGSETYEEWLTELAFDIRVQRYIPEGAGGHTLFLAQNRKI